jgi:hypothetical protein
MWNKAVEWFGNRPVHFGILVVGVCVCFGLFATSCARVLEAEYQYKIERNKTWQKESEVFWNRNKGAGDGTSK